MNAVINDFADGEMNEAAEKYFKQLWCKGDFYHCKIFTDFPSGWSEKRADKLKRAMGNTDVGYRIIRCFEHKYESGERQFEPIFCIMDGIAKIGSDPVATVEECAIKFKGKYNKYLLSAASKLLWFKFKSPIIIYDENVRKCLGTPQNFYRAYCEKWREEYDKRKAAIDSACKHLAENNSGNNDIICKSWFKKRVFDYYLWKMGEKK